MNGLVVEYALAYGGPPAPDLPWPLFILLCREAGRAQARSLLTSMNGTAWAIARAFTKDGQLETMRSHIERLAYPEEKAAGKNGPGLVIRQSHKQEKIGDD